MTDTLEAELSDSVIETMAKQILGREELSDSELDFIWALVTEMNPIEFTVSASETRQIRQYEPNQYYASMKFSLANTPGIILDMMRKADPAKRVQVFVDCKRILYGTISERYKKDENYLRKLLQDQQTDDGIPKR